MPGGDGTGPLGWGPGTGRAVGFCRGFDRPGFANPVRGGFRRFGYAGGRQPYTSAGEINELQNQAQFLRERIQQIESRLNELQNTEENK